MSDDVPTLVGLYKKWEKTDEVTALLVYLRNKFPFNSELDVAKHALDFSSTHLMAYLVAAVSELATGEEEDPDRPPWM